MMKVIFNPSARRRVSTNGKGRGKVAASPGVGHPTMLPVPGHWSWLPDTPVSTQSATPNVALRTGWGGAVPRNERARSNCGTAPAAVRSPPTISSSASPRSRRSNRNRSKSLAAPRSWPSRPDMNGRRPSQRGNALPPSPSRRPKCRSVMCIQLRSVLSAIAHPPRALRATARVTNVLRVIGR